MNRDRRRGAAQHQGGGPALRPRNGIVHHYTPLHQVTVAARGMTIDRVLRREFRDLCDVTAKLSWPDHRPDVGERPAPSHGYGAAGTAAERSAMKSSNDSLLPSAVLT
jgi:hypothetical protein